MAATSRPSDDRINDERLSQLDLPPSTSATQQQQQQHQKSSRESETRRRCGCKDQQNNVPYMIEDLDAIELAPLDNKSGTRTCGCEPVSCGKQLEDLRKHRSTETRWSNSFLSPDDAVKWNPRKLCTSDSTEFRWALHTSSTDVDIARSARMKCAGCHSLTPEEKKPERGDLRKHHSAETDKWTLRPDVVTPRPDLRKHNSDDVRMDRQQAKWTLQVPEVLPNPKPRCACSKMMKKKKKKSPSSAKTSAKEEPDRKIVYSRSLTPDEMTVSTVVEVETKRHASEDSRWTSRGEITKDQEGSMRKWPGKSHFPLPMEKNETKWTRIHHSSFGESSKDRRSARERQRSAIRKIVSPEPEARALLRTDEDIQFTRRPPNVSPDITITNAKWASSYEEQSPLPNVGIKKKRQQIRISDIKWIPCDGSSTDLSYDQDNPINWSPFRHVTPTCYPPPEAALPLDENSDDGARWKLLNQISPFPIYQGAWRNESPLKILTPEEPSRPIWSAQESSSPLKKLSTRKQHESEYGPIEERPIPQVSRSNRQRPQLSRSKALLEVPVMDPTKRSLSEEVPRYRMNDGARGPNRARSEEAPKYENPWFANNLVFESAELCQYVTTV